MASVFVVTSVTVFGISDSLPASDWWPRKSDRHISSTAPLHTHTPVVILTNVILKKCITCIGSHVYFQGKCRVLFILNSFGCSWINICTSLTVDGRLTVLNTYFYDLFIHWPWPGCHWSRLYYVYHLFVCEIFQMHECTTVSNQICGIKIWCHHYFCVAVVAFKFCSFAE